MLAVRHEFGNYLIQNKIKSFLENSVLTLAAGVTASASDILLVTKIVIADNRFIFLSLTCKS